MDTDLKELLKKGSDIKIIVAEILANAPRFSQTERIDAAEIAEDLIIGVVTRKIMKHFKGGSK